MAPSMCRICDHPSRQAIEIELAAKTPLREIAQRFVVGRSTLGRHKVHLSPLPVPAPAAALPESPPTPPVLPPVATCQAAVQALLAEQAQLPGQIQALQKALTETAFDRNICRDIQRDKSQLPALEAQVKTLQDQLATFKARSQALPQLITQAEDARNTAVSRRQVALTAHWQWVEAQKSAEEWDAWSEGEGELILFTLALNLFYGGGSGPVGGRAPTPSASLLHRYGSMPGLDQRRRQMVDKLLERFPFERGITAGSHEKEHPMREETLTAYELSLSPSSLYAYMEKEARNAWPVMKGPHVAYDAAQGMAQLIKSRPGLYQRYTRLVQNGATEDSPLRDDLEAIRSARHSLEALRNLEEVAKAYGGGQDGMDKAVALHPDLYKAYTQAVQSEQRVVIRKEMR